MIARSLAVERASARSEDSGVSLASYLPWPSSNKTGLSVFFFVSPQKHLRKSNNWLPPFFGVSPAHTGESDR